MIYSPAMNRSFKFVLLSLPCVVLAACVSTPPKGLDNLCAIFEEKRRWYKHAKKASKKWGVPIAVNMAFMHQESRFRAKAKPPRTRILWIFPGPRKSSAFGYAQAKKETWNWYKNKSGHSGADRDDFDDAVDFIAWYNNISHKKLNIQKNDAYRLYLAYHEGHGGFSRGTYKQKSWLSKVAKKVSTRAASYQTQLNKCEKKLASSWWPFW